MPGILFTHGYFLQDDAKEQQIMRPYPPLGMLYVSAWLTKHGLENRVFDTTFSTMEKLQEEILSSRPEFLCMYVNL
ncbi:MAG TPA: B12-binding domain-containing radical SAM protein, partial [Chitinophagales bacterium]|nr:B12-binding domain-containing radical SAM protein [Chitinophagales bacterium]